MEYSAEALHDEERHVEQVDGDFVVVDMTTTTHNNAVMEIATALKMYIKRNGGNYSVYTENVALYCDELCNSKGNMFLPDVMAVCSDDPPEEDGIHVVPRFVVEVTSESTRRLDYQRKMVIYCEMGVAEYWIVDIQKSLVVRYFLSNDYVPEIFAYPNVTVLPVSVYPGLEIDLSQIF